MSDAAFEEWFATMHAQPDRGICLADKGYYHGCWFAAEQAVGSERDKLAAFKAWTHTYLDGKGIPANPGGPHTAEGCRIGDRLDLVFRQRDCLLTSLKEMHAWFVGPGKFAHDPNPKLTDEGREIVQRALAAVATVEGD